MGGRCRNSWLCVHVRAVALPASHCQPDRLRSSSPSTSFEIPVRSSRGHRWRGVRVVPGSDDAELDAGGRRIIEPDEDTTRLSLPLQLRWR